MFKKFTSGDILLLVAALLSLVFSEIMWFTGNKEQALFVGLWVPSILCFVMFLRFWESQNSNSGSHKTKIFSDKVPFILEPLIGLMHNSTTSKEPTHRNFQCLQKRALKLVL